MAPLRIPDFAQLDSAELAIATEALGGRSVGAAWGRRQQGLDLTLSSVVS